MENKETLMQDKKCYSFKKEQMDVAQKNYATDHENQTFFMSNDAEESACLDVSDEHNSNVSTENRLYVNKEMDFLPMEVEHETDVNTINDNDRQNRFQDPYFIKSCQIYEDEIACTELFAPDIAATSQLIQENIRRNNCDVLENDLVTEEAPNWRLFNDALEKHNKSVICEKQENEKLTIEKEMKKTVKSSESYMLEMNNHVTYNTKSDDNQINQLPMTKYDLCEFQNMFAKTNDYEKKMSTDRCSKHSDVTSLFAEKTVTASKGDVISNGFNISPAVEQGIAKKIISLFENRKENNVSNEFKTDIDFNKAEGFTKTLKEKSIVTKSLSTDVNNHIPGDFIVSIANKSLFPNNDNILPKLEKFSKVDCREEYCVTENTSKCFPSFNSYNEKSIPQGIAKTLIEKWKTNDLENHNDGTKSLKYLDINAIIEAGQASQSGIFENDPEVRIDVSREEDQLPEVKSLEQMKATKELWHKMVKQNPIKNK
ncbi:hypothetical protein HELRODRAFT_161239 [Helobdella robusta]|uniref:Uncharacterized protein n=1 Tax=Helobdella robusta TaxID=6412 RepID=T1ER89_HELRO|nr:hypothetical protein HELRODRAFT_161239 [Helobdella robusta]ESO02018.1 hypothetical protein HELRODRAFT_161239 [Helobdella robusta]